MDSIDKLGLRLDILCHGLRELREDMQDSPGLIRNLCPDCRERWTKFSRCSYCNTNRMRALHLGK